MDSTQVEDIEEFRLRARLWLSANVPKQPVGRQVPPVRSQTDEEQLARIDRCRELQRLYYEGGFAGISVPREYGGQGLTGAHQEAFNRELVDYEYPAEIQIPTFAPCMAVILEFGTEDQKKRHIPPILRGETLWMQLLSEPGGGSDVAGAQTTAVRDGEEWVINGSKIWTTGAWWANWGLCLVRTNWDVEKHRGLTVFMLPLHQSGIEIQRIEMLDGTKDFCQEFLTEVRVPDANRIGEVDQGWTVGIRWMYHERTVDGGSPYVTRPPGPRPGRGLPGGAHGLLARAAGVGHLRHSLSSELVGEVFALELVGRVLTERIAHNIMNGDASDQAAAITRLYSGTTAVRTATISFELSGQAVVAWESDDENQFVQPGVGYLTRQAACIGGGTTEISRNVISERVLGMPRDQAPDRSIPFRDVIRGTQSELRHNQK
jgi:alkylation response protein AidB-like acyl-CoA dehydrogenase